MFTGNPYFQKNTGFLRPEKIFFPYTQEGSFFCIRVADLEEEWEEWELWLCDDGYGHAQWCFVRLRGSARGRAPQAFVSQTLTAGCSR